MEFNIENIADYLHNEALLKSADSNALEQIVHQFPYSGLLQLLYCKYLHLHNDIKFESQLEKCALAVADRKRVYELLFQSSLQQQIIEQDNLATEKQPKDSTKEKTIPFEADNAKEQQKEVSSVKKEAEKNTLDELEQNIIAEAVNASIQVDIAAYEFEEQEEQEESVEDVAKEETSVDLSQERSFVSWFDKPVVSKPKKTQSSANLIDEFLSSTKHKEKIKKDVFSPSNMAKMSLVSNNQFVTETLATIYAQQGQIDKAIEIYKQLSLKNPEKKTFFASRIRFLEEKQQYNK